MATEVTVVSTIETVTVGGRVFSDLSGLIVAGVYLNGGAVQYGTFRKNNTTSGYQVTSGKTYQIGALTWFSSAAGHGFGLGYGDNDRGLDGDTTPPTNAVWQFGAAGGGDGTIFYMCGTAYTLHSQATKFNVPSQKYPAATSTSAINGGVQVFGYEV